MHASKPAPMTNAERQRRHRAKRQRELQALRAVVPATAQERESAAQVQRLAAQLEKATRTAAALQERVEALQAHESAALQLQEALHTLLDKLPPAARNVAAAHLTACGVALPALAPPDALEPPPRNLAHLFF